MAETIIVDSAGSDMPISTSKPDGEARGAVIVIQEAFGITEHIEDICRRLSDVGFYAAAPHIFHRSGDPVIPYGDMQDVMPHLGALSVEGLEADISATIDHLASAGFSTPQVGIVGFCMGGSVVVLAAANHDLGAAVSFYGGGIAAGRFGIPPLVELAPSLQTPWLGFFGDADASIPTDQVESMREAAKHASVPTEVVRYPEAEHGFNCDVRPSYHEASAKDAWGRTLDWFEANLAKD
jgi:carboxymethylenebutenolidase